jgi:hypothetical protein
MHQLEDELLRIMKNCKDGCPRLRNMDEEKSMDRNLDD